MLGIGTRASFRPHPDTMGRMHAMKPMMLFALMGANSRQLGAVLLVFLVATLVMGLIDAWSKKRGVLGWIVSILASFVGGIFGTVSTAAVLDTPKLLHLDGTLLGTACLATGLLLGSWFAVRIANRFR